MTQQTKKLYLPLLILSLGIIALGCNSVYTNKPRGYFKIDFPEHEYQVFDREGFPYTFEYPVYASISQDSTFFEEQPENPYWINIDIPRFAGRIYLSYNRIGGKSRFKIKNKKGEYIDSIGLQTFERLVEGSYTLAFKHSVKANNINDSIFTTASGVEGIYFSIGGEAATANQFFVTDSSKHFLRGALYFDASPKADSLRIVNDFLKVDMKHMINTLKWKETASSR